MSRLLLICLVAATFVPVAHAADPAFDSAAGPAYNGGWPNGINGGTGFGPWTITTNNDNTQHFAGTFIGDAGASSANPGINTSGRAFGMYSNTSGNTDGASVSATRDFSGGPLSAGQSFSLDIAINYRDGSKGIILNGDGRPFGPTLGAFDTGGYPEHHSLVLYDVVTLQNVSYSFSDYYPDSLFHLTFTMIDNGHLQAHLTRTTAGGTVDIVTLSVNSRPPTGFNLFYGSTATYHPQNDLFFNNFSVGPATLPLPVVLDFQALEHAGTGYTSVGYIYKEKGFVISDASPSNGLAVWNTSGSGYTGSTALFDNDSAGTTLSREDGGQFDFLAIDIAALYSSGSGPIWFYGYRNSELVATESFYLNGGLGVEHYTPSNAFRNVTEVRWLPGNPAHQFDNVYVRAIGGPLPLRVGIRPPTSTATLDLSHLHVGTNYAVQRSTDLATWTSVSAFTAYSSMTTFNIPVVPGQKTGFYRLSWTP